MTKIHIISINILNSKYKFLLNLIVFLIIYASFYYNEWSMVCTDEEIPKINWKKLYDASEKKIKLLDSENRHLQQELSNLEAENVDLSVSLYNSQEEIKKLKENIARIEERNKLIEVQNLCFWREIIEQRAFNKITMKEIVHSRAEIENISTNQEELILSSKKTKLNPSSIENAISNKKARKNK